MPTKKAEKTRRHQYPKSVRATVRAVGRVPTQRVRQPIEILHADENVRPGPLLARDVKRGGITCKLRFEQELHEADMSQAAAWSGIPSSYGKIRLEQDPELVPMRARGYGGNPGLFYDLLNSSEVESALEEYVSAVVSAPYSLEPAEVPPWFVEDEAHLLAAIRHYEYAQRVWYEWTRAGLPRDLWTMASELARTTPVFGFYVGEIVAVPYVWQLTGDPYPRVYWVPKPLEWRAPWTVCEWLLQADRQVGVVLNNTYQVMSDGKVGKFQIALPRRKYIHVQGRMLGPNPEGRSHLRCVYENVQMLRDAKEIEALSIEANGLGTMVVQDGTSSDDPLGGMGKGQRDAIEDHLSNYNARHVPWLLLPRGVDAKVLSPSASIHEMGGPITRHERSIAFGLGSEGRLIGTQKHGSHAARESASNDTWRPYSHAANGYVARPIQELIRRMTVWNFPEDVVTDRIYASYVRVGRVEKTTTAERLDNMGRAAALVGTPLQDAALREVGAMPADIAGPTTTGGQPNG